MKSLLSVFINAIVLEEFLKLKSSPGALNSKSPEPSRNTALLAGNVQNTSLVPAEKLTAESELELLIIVVLANVSGEASVLYLNQLQTHLLIDVAIQ